MNMKKTRGFVDPFTLGFILAAVIGAGGLATANSKAHQAKVQPQPQQTAYVVQDNTRQKQVPAQKDKDSISR